MPTGQANRLMPTLRRVVMARETAARSDGELLGAFVNARDADAFAELVRRHGPMVLGVCRRLVCEHATADDAFQAVFLVLARRAASVRPREQVGNWLYGVAYRTALKARMVLARRRSREKQVDAMPEPTATATVTADWGDLQAVIDEELAKLPDKLRVPVVLCDLEGRPQREVAKQLKVPPATLATRLASARRTLARRLTRRGVTLSGGALAGLLGLHGAAGAVPPALAGGAILAGEAVASGAALGSLVSVNAVQLSEGVMRMMMLAKLKAVAVTIATALVLTTGLGAGLVPAASGGEPGAGKGRGFSTALAGAAPSARPADIDVPVKVRPQADPKADDASFLRRLCMDVRGTLPTEVETWFFVSDDDGDKRAKVAEWLASDGEARIIVAKKLGVAADRVKVIRVRAEGKGGDPFVFDSITPAPGTKKDANPVEQSFQFFLAEGAKGDAPGDVLIPKLLALLGDEKPPAKVGAQQIEVVVEIGGDAEFLNRVMADVRGNAPTALEMKYFTEDKDPKKREKLLDALLKDAAVQKKLGDEWKKKMLSFKSAQLPQGGARMIWLVQPDGAVKEGKIEMGKPKVVPLPPKPGVIELEFAPSPPAPPKPPVAPKPPGIEFKLVPAPPAPPKPPKPVEMEFKLAPTPGKPATPAAKPAPQAGKFEKLVGELIAAGKSDEAILEALTLATQGRLPTDVEKKLLSATIGGAKDRKAAWVAVAKALAGGPDAKKAESIELKLELKP